MKKQFAALVGIVFVGMALTAVAGGGNAEKLIGVWNDAKVEGKSIEFSKDGKVKMQEKAGKKTVVATGTYTLKEKTLTITIIPPGKEKGEVDVASIKTLTDKELILQVEEKGKTTELQYKRAK